MQVLAISCDSVPTQRVFADQEEYKFPVLSDFWPHGDVAQAYGVFVAEKGIANRATFVIDINGNIAGEIITDPGQARDFAAYKAIIENL